jgi:4-hydroxy-4-methyl-2-oxoglutarate aldolase
MKDRSDLTSQGLTVFPRTSVSWDPALIERFRKVAPSTIGHFVEDGFMDPGIKPLSRNVKLVGPAVTVRQLSNRSVMSKAIELARPGDVIVVDRGGERRRATGGDNTARRCQRAGIAGMVIDGPSGDVIEIQEMGFLVFSRGVAALHGVTMAREGTINAPVSCGDVIVRPGDLILGDDNGIVVIQPETAEAILVQAEAIEADEARRRSLP